MGHNRAAIVSHDLTIVEFPPSDRHRSIEVSRDVFPRRPSMHQIRDGSRSSARRSYCPSDEDRSLLVTPRVTPGKHQSRHLKHLKRTCFDGNRVDSGPRDRRLRLSRFHLTSTEMPRRLHIKISWEHSPTRKKRQKRVSIKGGAGKRICVTAPNS